MNDQLGRLRALLSKVSANADGMISLADLISTGMNAEDFRGFRTNVFGLRKPVPSAAELTGPALGLALGDTAKWNQRINGLARLAFCCAQALEDNDDMKPDLLIASVMVEPGEDPSFVLQWREPLTKALRPVSTLILDGTGDVALLKRWFTRLEVTADIGAKMPAGVEILQVYDKLNGYQSWTPQGDPAAEDATEISKTADNNLHRLARMLEALHRQYGDVAAVVPKATEAWLTAHWNDLPPVRLAHFGAIRGFDGFKGVRCLVIWSRPSAKPYEVERYAAVARGSWGESLGSNWFAKGPGAYVMTDGSARAAKGVAHPDPMAERFRWQTCEAELLQAVARGRGIRRSADRPLTVIIGTNVPLPLEVDQLITNADLFAEATPVDDLLAKGVIPAPGKGRWLFMAAALGKRSENWRDFCRNNPGAGQRLDAAALNREKPYIDIHVGDFPFEREEAASSRWKVKARAGDRYSCLVWLDDVVDGDVEAARAKLASVKVNPAELIPAKVDGKAKSEIPTRAPLEFVVAVTENVDIVDFVGASADREPMTYAPDLSAPVVQIPIEFVPPPAPPSEGFLPYVSRDYLAEMENSLAEWDTRPPVTPPQVKTGTRDDDTCV